MISYRVGDLLPALTILVKDGGQTTNLSTLDVYVRWQYPDGTEIAERQATVVNGDAGMASYEWQAGDLSKVGIMRAMIQLSPEGNSAQRYSLTNPPLIEIEVLEDAFPDIDATLPMLPTPTGSEVADALQVDVSALDGSRLLYSIQRARSLLYTYAELWRCPALVLDPIATRMARDLVVMLAAQNYATNPLVIFGPMKKEVFGSYSYELKEGNIVTTRQQTGGKTGIPAADSILSYLMWLCRGCDPNVGGIEIMYPDWTQPVTTVVPDPTFPIT